MEDRVDHEWEKCERNLAREKPDKCHCCYQGVLVSH